MTKLTAYREYVPVLQVFHIYKGTYFDRISLRIKSKEVAKAKLFLTLLPVYQ
jgi:hypothetical protein